MITRRHASFGILGAGTGLWCATSSAAESDPRSAPSLAGRLEAIERERGGRLGVAVLDSASGEVWSYRADELFPLCSTFKVLAVAAFLTRIDRGQDRLEERVRFEPSDVVVDSPITKTRAGGDGMSFAEICAAAITYSDNTAGNLLLARLGGPEAITNFARSLGDQVTRLDRNEPTLNEAIPGDPRDTTSPAAMMKDLQALVAGNPLSDKSRDQLIAWLVGNKTGDRRLRAGLPSGWRVGDKTGAGERGTTNDIAVIWRQSAQQPLFVSVYLTGSRPEPDFRNETIATVGRTIASALG